MNININKHHSSLYALIVADATKLSPNPVPVHGEWPMNTICPIVFVVLTLPASIHVDLLQRSPTGENDCSL